MSAIAHNSFVEAMMKYRLLMRKINVDAHQDFF